MPHMFDTSSEGGILAIETIQFYNNLDQLQGMIDFYKKQISIKWAELRR